jgi:hypothetical protein
MKALAKLTLAACTVAALSVAVVHAIDPRGVSPGLPRPSRRRDRRRPRKELADPQGAFTQSFGARFLAHRARHVSGAISSLRFAVSQ